MPNITQVVAAAGQCDTISSYIDNQVDDLLPLNTVAFY